MLELSAYPSTIIRFQIKNEPSNIENLRIEAEITAEEMKSIKEVTIIESHEIDEAVILNQGPIIHLGSK